MCVGIVDVGGGYRGIYAAGVLDYCMDEGIDFDLGIGVSAGSANIASYAAGQSGRNFKFYSEYGCRKKYASARNFLTKRSYIDLDYVYSTLSNSDGEYPLDYSAIKRNPMELYVVATDAKDGEAMYFDRTYMMQDEYDILKASCALPLVCRPYEIDNVKYFDGGLSDPVPIEKAFELGCDQVVLLLTKPVDYVMDSHNDEKIAKFIRHAYPNASEELCTRAERYNAGVAAAQKYAEDGNVLIVAPDDTCGVNTLTREPELLENLYQKGYEDGEKIKEFLGYC